MGIKEKLVANLSGSPENHILPFLWVHGEDEATIRSYIHVIHNAGIGAVCIESRPHPDFVGPKWWFDMDIILDEAKKCGMKVWILDDSHFPTGFANGAMAKEPESKCRKSIVYAGVDYDAKKPADVAAFLRKGPSGGGVMGTFVAMGNKNSRKYSPDKLLAVTAFNKTTGERRDVTDLVRDGKLQWTAPGPDWKIGMLKESFRFGPHPSYINMLQEDSCRVLIDAVYEPHWEHYKEEFGKTIAGFFSDEPELGNGPAYSHETLGTPTDQPWSDVLIPVLEASMGADWKNKLLYLWENDLDADETAKIRWQYMDAVTRAVQHAFSEQVGSWCRDHGVEYIGHVVEDLNGHSRTGGALGHYFRGLWGQDMAGIDDIGGQVYPQGEEKPDKWMKFMDRDGEFYHYTLGRLAPSLAALDEKKHGRTMCEIFGNYGWSEGLRLEKFLADHFLSCNVNYFVPHAFSMKPFPDSDCPPHFYAHGHNPQYKHFRYLMEYMNRVASLTTDGHEIVPAAVLYNAESEWTNQSMLDQTVLHELLDRQINAELVPVDAFADPDTYHTDLSEGLCVNGQKYKCFVIPETAYISSALAEAIRTLTAKGFAVAFVNRKADRLYDTSEAVGDALEQSEAVPLGQLADWIYEKGCAEIKISKPWRRLRYLHYENGQELYLFVNEETTAFNGTITLPKAVDLCAYNAWDNRMESVTYEKDAEADETVVTVCLEPLQSQILICGEADSDAAADANLLAETDANPLAEADANPLAEADANPLADAAVKPLAAVAASLKPVYQSGQWSRSTCTSLEYPKFSPSKQVSLPDALAKENAKFSGWVRYEAIVRLEAAAQTILEITDAYESVEVTVNGTPVGVQVAPTARFDITSAVREGVNNIRIDVATTLERERAAALNKGGIEMMMNLGIKMNDRPPVGLAGNVKILQ